jgi:hypothetical protein
MRKLVLIGKVSGVKVDTKLLIGRKKMICSKGAHPPT